MLKVTKLGLGQQAYFEKQVAKGMDDYYSGRGEAPGVWRGRLAERLGLTGQVSAAQFNALLAGLDPRDPEALPLVSEASQERKVAAYDLTFSAPKSVSVLAAVADGPVRLELHEAHESAVDAALDFIQDEAARVRRGKGGTRVEATGGVVSAGYRHRMSRAQDPHLHTHVVAAAIAPGADGRWTSLDARPLYRMAKAAGTIYQSHLRAEVGERLGLSWREPVQGQASFNAYGKPFTLSGQTSPLGYAGQYTDTDTSLIYMRARMYDPSTGQFATVDPFVDLSEQPYGYSGGDPVNYTDPSGLIAAAAAGPEAGAIAVGQAARGAAIRAGKALAANEVLNLLTADSLADDSACGSQSGGSGGSENGPSGGGFNGSGPDYAVVDITKVTVRNGKVVPVEAPATAATVGDAAEQAVRDGSRLARERAVNAAAAAAAGSAIPEGTGTLKAILMAAAKLHGA